MSISDYLVLIFASFALGLITMYLKYRSQRRLLTRQRLAPILGRTLGNVSRLIIYAENSQKFQHVKLTNSSTPLGRSVANMLTSFSLRSTSSLVKECIEFENIFLELNTSGMFEILKGEDEVLTRYLTRVHEDTAHLGSGRKRFRTLKDVSGLEIPRQNLLFWGKDCEKRLGLFLRK